MTSNLSSIPENRRSSSSSSSSSSLSIKSPERKEDDHDFLARINLSLNLHELPPMVQLEKALRERPKESKDLRMLNLGLSFIGGSGLGVWLGLGLTGAVLLTNPIGWSVAAGLLAAGLLCSYIDRGPEELLRALTIAAYGFTFGLIPTFTAISFFGKYTEKSLASALMTLALQAFFTVAVYKGVKFLGSLVPKPQLLPFMNKKEKAQASQAAIGLASELQPSLEGQDDLEIQIPPKEQGGVAANPYSFAKNLMDRIENDEEAALKEYKISAAQGDNDSRFHLFEIYTKMHSDGTRQDFYNLSHAKDWLRSFLNGGGSEKRVEDWLAESPNKELVEVFLLDLGEMYAKGEETPQNLDKAKHWLGKLVDQGGTARQKLRHWLEQFVVEKEVRQKFAEIEQLPDRELLRTLWTNFGQMCHGGFNTPDGLENARQWIKTCPNPAVPSEKSADQVWAEQFLVDIR